MNYQVFFHRTRIILEKIHSNI